MNWNIISLVISDLILSVMLVTWLYRRGRKSMLDDIYRNGVIEVIEENDTRYLSRRECDYFDWKRRL